MEKKAIPNSLAPRSRKPKSTKPEAKPIPVVKPEPVAVEKPAPVKAKAVTKTAAKPKKQVKEATAPPAPPKDDRKRFNFLMDKVVYKKMKMHCMDQEITGANYIESLIMKDLGL